MEKVNVLVSLVLDADPARAFQSGGVARRIARTALIV